MHRILKEANPTSSVDLLITDLQMPQMNGMELIQAAKDMRPGLVAVQITAHGDDHVRKVTKSLGFCEYLDKPFGPERFLNLIRGLERTTL
jgi:DNA-binding NtrC family response regulator